MNFIKFISILFLIVLFTNCVSAQSKSKSTESYDISKNTVLVLYCQDTNEAYYLKDENEINYVLSLFPKTLNAEYSSRLRSKKLMLLNVRAHYSRFMYLINDSGIKTEIAISVEDNIWDYKDKSDYHYFPSENMEKIISKMHKGIKKTENFEKPNERRQFVEKLRSDSDVLYIKLEPDFDIIMGECKLYVPTSKGEKVDTVEVEKKLTSLYGETQRFLWKNEKILNNFSLSSFNQQFIEETNEAEITLRCSKELYDKINVYRKGDFIEDNYYKMVEYYTKK